MIKISNEQQVKVIKDTFYEMTAMQQFMVGIIKLYHNQPFTQALSRVLDALASVPAVVKTRIYYDFATLEQNLKQGNKYVVLATQLGVIRDDNSFGLMDPTMENASTEFLRSLHKEILGKKVNINKQKKWANEYAICRIKYKNLVQGN